MKLKIKDWNKYQHFKDRSPPWIKLYKDILDDPDWHDLSGDTSKVLVSLWLIASEDETKQGLLPDLRRLSFRLRITEHQLKQHLNKLSHWLIQDDINMISERYQVDAPETETETETELETETNTLSDFEQFWEAYPKKVSKKKAQESWNKLKIKPLDKILIAINNQKKSDQWQKENGAFIPNPSTWLNQERWNDQLPIGGRNDWLRQLTEPNTNIEITPRLTNYLD